MNLKNNFMLRAIELSINSVNAAGGPFGCVIVKENKIIAEGSNKVTSSNDPTAHAEIVAIREACKKFTEQIMKNKFMTRAIELSIESVNSGGGPFGSIIVKNDKVIAEGANKVTLNNDPTAHGEIVAIRKACKNLNNFNLSGCELYSTCEPCPMCLSAIYWSHIEKVYYANTRDDAQKIDFDDSLIYS